MVDSLACVHGETPIHNTGIVSLFMVITTAYSVLTQQLIKKVKLIIDKRERSNATNLPSQTNARHTGR